MFQQKQMVIESNPTPESVTFCLIVNTNCALLHQKVETVIRRAEVNLYIET